MTNALDDSRAHECGRVTWAVRDLAFKDEPLLLALLKYRMSHDRTRSAYGELVSSFLSDSRRHMPLLDLDTPCVLYGRVLTVSRGINLYEPKLHVLGAWLLKRSWCALFKGSTMPSPVQVAGQYVDLPMPENFRLVPSASKAHFHLYLNVALSRLQMFRILFALYLLDVLEMGFFYWSLRRRGTFLRRAGVPKPPEEQQHYSFGLVRRLRPHE